MNRDKRVWQWQTLSGIYYINHASFKLVCPSRFFVVVTKFIVSFKMYDCLNCFSNVFGMNLKQGRREKLKQKIAFAILMPFCLWNKNCNSGLCYKHIKIKTTPLESSVSGAIIWSITLELSITILVVSFPLINDVYSKGITYDDRNMFIVQATELTCSLNNLIRTLRIKNDF